MAAMGGGDRPSFTGKKRSASVFNGILKCENSSEVVLAINATETVSLKREEVEAVTVGTVSVMPSGLDQQLTVQELADLLAFLRSRKER